LQAPGVLVVGPGGDFLTVMGNPGEQCLVEQLIAHRPMEALDESVLGGLAWRRLVPLNPGFAAPFEHRVRGQFGAVLADDQAGHAANGD
jgi:hypothetical protein